MTWETVIGLEVHVQLATVSKMFCGCAASYGDAPNTNVCPVCLGLPGALPVPNATAVRLGVRGALALGCAVHPTSIFARKNYFYPDLPKGYQISQFDRPLATGGAVVVERGDAEPLVVSITRLHLEEDAGKSLHDRIPGMTAVDLNRAGTPLAEIVSGPDLRSPAEARAYLVTLRQLLVYAGVSECSMEKGSLRVDANLSVHRPGTPFGTKTEVKNMNSFANVERALTAERERQVALLESGGRVAQVTLTFNAATGDVRPLRSKEESHDYRYFPDPDLRRWCSTRHGSSASGAAAGAARPRGARATKRQFALPAYDARVLTQEPAVAHYFEAVVAAGVDAEDRRQLGAGRGAGVVERRGRVSRWRRRASPSWWRWSSDGTLSLQAAKRVYDELTRRDASPRVLAEELGLLQVRDDDALAEWVDAVLADHPGRGQRGSGTARRSCSASSSGR